MGHLVGARVNLLVRVRVAATDLAQEHIVRVAVDARLEEVGRRLDTLAIARLDQLGITLREAREHKPAVSLRVLTVVCSISVSVIISE